ncbi:MAG TPA: DUF305 domain-containing protein [Candidatus Paceibacterota bacterium]
MNQKHKMLIVGLAMLAVGFGTGFAVAASGSGTHAGKEEGGSYRTGGHSMPDGTMHGAAHGDMQVKNASMQAMMHDMNAGLEGKQGEEFDKAFIREMIVHHEGAIQMSEAALRNAGRQEIRDLSSAIIEAQKKEIDQMKKWEAAWYAGPDADQR